MNLKCWGEGWGLPSIDIECLSVLIYAYFAKVPVTKIQALPKDTITGSLPELEQNDLIYSRAFTIIGIFRRDGYNADFHLSEGQNADTLAYLALIKTRLLPAVLYTMWIDAENYTKVTRPAYAKSCGFPWSLWYPNKMRQSVQQFLVQSKRNMLDISELEKTVCRDAHSCLTTFERMLDGNNFIFGDSPTTLDAFLFSHVALLLRVPFVTELKLVPDEASLVNHELPTLHGEQLLLQSRINSRAHPSPLLDVFQNHLKSCANLCQFISRMEKFHSGHLRSASSAASDLNKKFKINHVIAVCVAVITMSIYAVTSGVLTERRSKLAQRIESYKSARASELEPID